jgi:hypothetical protein
VSTQAAASMLVSARTYMTRVLTVDPVRSLPLGAETCLQPRERTLGLRPGVADQPLSAASGEHLGPDAGDQPPLDPHEGVGDRPRLDVKEGAR